VLFRGNAEAHIRRALVRKGYIKGIIGLPANLFYGTGSPPASSSSTSRTPTPARASS
jgi:type I restriction-modification system DNA methylase subunit